MKITEIQEYKNYINKFDLANLFNIYDDNKLGSNYKAYNLNRSIFIKGLEDIPAVDLLTYKVRDFDTLNSISFKTYGTIELWWLIAKINNIYDATITLKPGWTLYLLSNGIGNQILNAIRE